MACIANALQMSELRNMYRKFKYNSKTICHRHLAVHQWPLHIASSSTVRELSLGLPLDDFTLKVSELFSCFLLSRQCTKWSALYLHQSCLWRIWTKTSGLINIAHCKKVTARLGIYNTTLLSCAVILPVVSWKLCFIQVLEKVFTWPWNSFSILEFLTAKLY